MEKSMRELELEAEVSRLRILMSESKIELIGLNSLLQNRIFVRNCMRKSVGNAISILEDK